MLERHGEEVVCAGDSFQENHGALFASASRGPDCSDTRNSWLRALVEPAIVSEFDLIALSQLMPRGHSSGWMEWLGSLATRNHGDAAFCWLATASSARRLSPTISARASLFCRI